MSDEEFWSKAECDVCESIFKLDQEGCGWCWSWSEREEGGEVRSAHIEEGSGRKI